MAYEHKLAAVVKAAFDAGLPLNITGNNSKEMFGRARRGAPLFMAKQTGIVQYDPEELVIVVRAGTPLKEVIQTLDRHQQMLGFEPPFVEQGATVGGAIATGLAGARRPYAGGVRDFILGAKIINGRGEIMQFGGTVMKNVAGFDLFRPMAGAYGSLGVLLEVAIRLLPKPAAEQTLQLNHIEQSDALDTMQRLGKELGGLTAAAWHDNRLYLRLAGAHAGLSADMRAIDRPFHESSAQIWPQISSMQHAWFAQSTDRLWRLSVPAATPPLALNGSQLIDWGGGLRWCQSNDSAQDIRALTRAHHGHATEVGIGLEQPFEALPEPLFQLQQRLKLAFDPKCILNRGILYSGL